MTTTQKFGDPPWKIINENGTWIRVVEFPVPPEVPYDSESMWIKVITGDDNNGIGILVNHPEASIVAKFGDYIRYAGGSSSEKPRYIETLSSEDSQEVLRKVSN